MDNFVEKHFSSLTVSGQPADEQRFTSLLKKTQFPLNSLLSKSGQRKKTTAVTENSAAEVGENLVDNSVDLCSTVFHGKLFFQRRLMRE